MAISSNRGITEGVIWKQILLFFFPILLGSFFQQMYNTVDTASALAGKLMDILQYCDFRNNEEAFYVIAAGQNPPNPVELLSSSRMEKLLEVLRKEFDYIIIDLPPVGEVSDAMAVAKQTDGMLLVVRQNYCDRIVLSEAVRQFEFINTRILGVVFNCTSEYGGKGYYKHYKHYRGYYKRYGKRYISNYENNDRSVTKSDGTQN